MSKLQCEQCKTGFEVSTEDKSFYKKMDVPEPTLCPTCRMQRRLAYRNDRSLYNSKSAKSGKAVISMYHPDSGFSVYEQKEWWVDDFNPLQYGRPYEKGKSFFEQYASLQKAVPRFNVFNRDTENCEYVNYAPHCKNCYLLFGSWFNENCLYGQTLNESRDCVDNLFLDQSELCYENVDCNKNYAALYCQNSSNVTDSYFCFDCKNVKNCIACYNLRNKEYHILNKPVSKEVFEKEKARLADRKNIIKLKGQFTDLVTSKVIHRAVIGLNNENVSGNFIFNCRNATHCFSLYRSQDVAFSARAFDLKDSYDFEGGGKSELLYENMSNDFSYNSIGCTTCENLSDAHYCDLSFNCEECFGCVGLRRKKHCILNQQYSKEEYETLKAQIITDMKKRGEWGQFPPIRLSQFAYNETMAQEYFPLSKEEALARGYSWKDEDKTSGYSGPKVAVPDSIAETPDEIVKQILSCETCGRNYKIVPQELEFYRKMNVPAPLSCPTCRHHARMAQRTPRRLFERNCAKCGTAIKTAYASERPETVYCEQCYLKEVY